MRRSFAWIIVKLGIGYFDPVVLAAAFVSLPTLVIEDLDTTSEVILLEGLLCSFFLLCINPSESRSDW